MQWDNDVKVIEDAVVNLRAIASLVNATLPITATSIIGIADKLTTILPNP